MQSQKIRNIAIIAHVDHGKTTLVDGLINQTRSDTRKDLGNLIMDNMDQERERGITIKAKNASVNYKDYKINIVDTPGHADFGGEVERALQMVDGAILLVDAKEGPMPQTKFVMKKAIGLGLDIVVVLNKVDKPGSDPERTLSKIEDLFLDLEASDEQMDFKVVYASGLHGKAGKSPNELEDNLFYLLDTVIESVPEPKITEDETSDNPFQLLTVNLNYDSFKGKMAIGKILGGQVSKNMDILTIGKNGSKKSKVTSILTFDELGMKEVEKAQAGEIVMLSGMEDVEIGDTITTPQYNQALPRIEVDKPTIQMTSMSSILEFCPITIPI